MSDIWIPTSLADLMDRVSILQVKLVHLNGEKRKIVKRQHATLTKILMGQDWGPEDLAELEEINLTLWMLEDMVREYPNIGEYKNITRWKGKKQPTGSK